MFHYAFAMVLGIAILITWFTLTGGGRMMDNLLSIINRPAAHRRSESWRCSCAGRMPRRKLNAKRIAL